MIKASFSILTLASMISTAALADNSSFVVAKNEIKAGTFQVSSSALKDLGLAVLEKCENLSSDDEMQLTTLTGQPGITDFKATLTRKAKNGSKIAVIGITAVKNSDVPFNTEYSISCLQRRQALQDQTAIKTEAQSFSQGSIRDLSILSAKLGNVILVTDVESDEVEFKEVQAVLVNYKQIGADGQIGLYTHTQAFPMNKASKAFVQKVLASNGNLNANELVNVVSSTRTVKSKYKVCVESRTEKGAPSIDDRDGDYSVITTCLKYKEVEKQTTYDVIGLAAKL